MKHALLHSQGSLDHLKQARSVLEEASCTIAALNRTPEDITELSALIDQQSKAANDGRTFLDLDQKFHTKIALISGNPIFEALTKSVFEWMKEFHHEAVRSVGLEPLTISEHREILAQITAQNAPQAAHAMKQHLERANALYHQEHKTNG
jgi:DNA-binding FadR family transcriptional regulator